MVAYLQRQQREEKDFKCGIHNLTYISFRAGCPACEAERETNQLRSAVQTLTNQIKSLTETNTRLKAQTDVVFAIREAADILDDDDLAFLKSVLYEWRDQKTAALKVTHGGKGRRQSPNGFIAYFRKGDPMGHLCSSVGGLAIAEYLDEAINTVGPVEAMKLLVRGMHPYLPGALHADNAVRSPDGES